MHNEEGFEKLKKFLGALRSFELIEFHSAIELGEELVKYHFSVPEYVWEQALKELKLSPKKAGQIMGMYVYRDLIITKLKLESQNVEESVKTIDQHKQQEYAKRMASLSREDLKNLHKDIDIGGISPN
jgi:hypothetical protein